MYSNDYLTKIYVQLNEYLANINVLLTKVKNLHYNVSGLEFFEVHELLDKYYETMSNEVDEVAERIRILDGFPDASLKIYLSKSKIQEIESKAYSYSDVASYLLNDFRILIELCHSLCKTAEGAHDIGTADLFTRNVQFYEKACWMLKAFSKA